MSISHRFEFRDEAQAQRFLDRVHDPVTGIRGLAIFREPGGSVVLVIDGDEPPRTEWILRLARESSATWAKWSG